MDELKIKDNKCIMTFSCNNPMDVGCVYFKDNHHTGVCVFAEVNNTSNNYYCRSAIACANKMTVKLKTMGLK